MNYLNVGLDSNKWAQSPSVMICELLCSSYGFPSTLHLSKSAFASKKKVLFRHYLSALIKSEHNLSMKQIFSVYVRLQMLC